MFRKKDADPMRPSGMGDKPADAGLQSPLEARGQGVAEPAASRPALNPLTRDTKPAPAAADDAGKRLIVGQGISLSGEITACDRLVVDGSVQVEHLEAYGVMRAAERAHVPATAILAIANRIGAGARAEWQANRQQAEAAAVQAVSRVLDRLSGKQ